jgi:hypothetical protein
MALFPNEFKNSRMHRVGFAVLGIGAVSSLFIALGIVRAGPCSVNMIGFFCHAGNDDWISSRLYFAHHCNDSLLPSKRNLSPDNTVTPS